MVKVPERIRPARAEPRDEGVDARRDQVVDRGSGHGLLVISGLPARGQHHLDLVRGQPPVAVADPDEAALGHSHAELEDGTTVLPIGTHLRGGLLYEATQSGYWAAASL